MQPRTNRAFSPARIVALLLIALVAVGLGYLRFAPDGERVSVPSGAQAGDLILEPCSYSTEDGSLEADCGTLVVPENRADPGSRVIALPVTRIRATSDDPKEPVFRLEGGPGKTNMEFEAASRLAGDRDVVLVGYRGVDGSVRLDCPEVVSALKRSGDFLGEKSMDARADALRACADRLQGDGVDLAGYTLPERVDDLEVARRAFGYDRINLVSESAGTRTAMIYSWRYPESIHRSAMIAVNPPGHFLWDAETTDAQLGRYAELCAGDEACRGRTDDLTASMRRIAADIPDRWGFLPIKEGNVQVASFWGLIESRSSEPLSAPMTLDSWLSAAEGDASGFWFKSLAADLLFPNAQVWGEVAAIARADARAAERYFSAGSSGSETVLGDAGTRFIWGGGRLLDAWPANESENQYARVQTSDVETLLIGGNLDFATPAKAATEELLPYLPNGRQVVLSDLGHTMDFWSYQPEASSRLLNAFFESGKVDDSLYEPAKVDFTPSMTQTAIAKGSAGTMIALALLAVLSLLLMARRVRRRGGFGRKASAVLRAVYPVVLGLGGWSFGALVVMTALPDVPLDDELLAVVATGLPVGLGIYWAWVHRDLSAATKTAGLVAALAGGLGGAWLGFHAMAGLPALLTTIAGAAGAANLILITLDILWARSAPARLPAATSSPAPMGSGA